MGITTRAVCTGVLAGMAAIVLSACSHSEPAPWKVADDSPWSAKREAEKERVDEGSSIDMTADPVLIAETESEPTALEPVEATETIVETEPVAEEVAVVAVEEKLTPEQALLAMDSSAFAVQVYASNTEESMDRFRKDRGLEDLMVLKTDRDGKTVYVLVDIQPDRASAEQAAGFLAKKSGSKPWVRSVAGLQKIVYVE